MCSLCVKDDSRIDRLHGPARFELEIRVRVAKEGQMGGKLSLDVLGS